MSESKAKPKAKPALRAAQTSKSATKSKSAPKTTAKRKPSAEAVRSATKAASRSVDERKGSVVDWRAETLEALRRIIHEADPEIVEERKWVKPSNPAGVPVWSQAGIVCTGETYKEVVKLTFARGASLEDPQGLFNSSLDGNMRRAIDIHEGEVISAKAFKALILAAIAENVRSRAPKAKAATKATAKSQSGARKSKSVKPQTSERVVLLSGGNPQIAKGDGDAPVQKYIAAMPGWKRDLGQRLDAIIVRCVPNVRKAVRWNSPFYGIEGQGWFLSLHVLTRYVKVTFFAGMSLDPIPSGGTPKSKEARWLDIYEDDPLDEAQMAAWVKQAAALPGWLA